MQKISLNGLWKVSGENDFPNFTGNVPGSVLNDLQNSGITENDFFYRDNAEKIQHFENYNWQYTKKFQLSKKDCFYKLIFENLDTYCDVYVNGMLAGSGNNGFIRHEFDISNLTKNGENEIEVRFFSPIKTVSGKKEREAAFTAERLNTRRMQCTYGWDWTMRFVTCGICGDVYILECGNETLVKNVYVYTENLDEDSAQIGIDTEFDNLCNGILTYEVFCEGSLVKTSRIFCAEKFLRVRMEIEEPKLWYPAGYGKANLYTLKIKNESGEIHSEEFGIRTVKIMQLPDEKGSAYYKKCLELKQSSFSKDSDENEEFSGFILKVNGIKIMCKGANYVPCEPFENGKSKEKIKEVLKMASFAGVNMIRVWGGGKFENPYFYDECSKLGIMVTQDFMMACGEYPEKEEWFLNELRKEAEYASFLLRNKACLMWWTGDNENATEGSLTDKDYRGRDSAFKAIAPVIYKNDPYRTFLPSSPYGGKKFASNTVGTTHNTYFMCEMFDYIEKEAELDFCGYIKNHRARFIAEEPTMGAVEACSMRKFMTEEDIFGDDLSMWNYHTKTNPPLDLFGLTCFFAEKILGKFSDGYDRYVKLKYIQYEWVRASMEQARREKWFCSGIILWMLNDCWPAASGWALIDYYNMPKAALYSFKRCAKDVMASIDKNKDGSFTVYISNDTAKECKASLNCYVLNYKTNEKKQIFEKDVFATNDENTAIHFEADLKENEIIICDLTSDGISDRSFYKKGTLPLIKSEESILIKEKGFDYIVVRAEGYVHMVVLTGNCIFADNYFSMVKGEEKKIFFEFNEIVSPCDITVSGYVLE